MLSAPKKSLGQNFLIDPNTARRIVACLDILPDQTILEIGPGRGALTGFLAASAGDLFVLEKDPGLIAGLKQRLPLLKIIAGDALRFDWTRLKVFTSFKVIGNLPYNIASPLIWDLVSGCGNCRKMVFCLQKEVARRICSAPGSREYGALSAWVQSFARVRLEFSIGPKVFRPRPKVDSAVLSLTPLDPKDTAPNPAKLARLLGICFQKRRKQLSTILRPYWSPDLSDWFAASGVPTSARPENLSPGHFQEISSIIFPSHFNIFTWKPLTTALFQV